MTLAQRFEQKGIEKGWQAGRHEGWQEGQQENVQAITLRLLKRQFRVFMSLNQALSLSSRQKQKKSAGLAALIRAFFSVFNTEIKFRAPYSMT